MANLTRIDPLDDLFRGFFVRPVDFNGQPQQPPAIRMDVRELNQPKRIASPSKRLAIQ